MAKETKRGRKNVGSLDKDIKNMKGTEDPESSIYIEIRQSYVLSLSRRPYFCLTFWNFDFSVCWTREYNKCPKPVHLFSVIQDK